MDEATRASALEKADAVVHKIGYPDFVVNATLLDQRYQQVRPLIVCYSAAFLLAYLFIRRLS